MPKVALIMGSDSDLPVVEPAAEILRRLGIGVEARVLSAHRTPQELLAYLESSEADVFICASGGAAHLAGVVAAHTLKPVIGLPVKGEAFAGLDALLSMAQMPPGVPVAVVSVGGGQNAGLFAARILGLGDQAIAQALADFRDEQRERVKQKDQKVRGKYHA